MYGLSQCESQTMADGGEKDTVHLKQGLQSIFRRETVVGLADNVVSSQRPRSIMDQQVPLRTLERFTGESVVWVYATARHTAKLGHPAAAPLLTPGEQNSGSERAKVSLEWLYGHYPPVTWPINTPNWDHHSLLLTLWGT